MYTPFPPSTPIPIPRRQGLQLSRAKVSSHSRRATMTIHSIEEKMAKAELKLAECERCKTKNERKLQGLGLQLLTLRSENMRSGMDDSGPLTQSSLRRVNKGSGRTKKKGKRRKRKTRRRR